ncbi:amidohydrolase family protein [Sediminibacterium sp.]|uniref:N-acyl-D-amino-acid deacylase family protein n=1 Tax=Sediminibacterium sp. TaxID=1917865 RepID=UPI002733069D|nr:D-aminoacylase [Sediminibacterium sp.]MDP3394572.1 D-aminoacylase [Sediminibacterium sp.]MDP3568407.1 D-aminoacylase [Sediminibacterium sp.]
MKNRSAIFFLLLFTFFQSQLNSQTNQSLSTLIQNVWIVDGSGSNAIKGGVRISGNRIVAVGNLKPLAGDMVVDGKEQYLSPGFIDSHSHHFGSLKKEPTGIAMTNQGITTIIIGQDGDSYPMDSLSAFFKQHQIAVNVASYTGHSSVREKIMGENNVFRKSTMEEIAQMKKYLATDLQKGSLGLSTGLEYESAFYSTKEEVVALAQLTASFKGRYMSHIRSEDIQLNEAIDEIIDIGKITGMPVKLSHIKIANKDDWGNAPLIIQKLELARKQGVDITADVYPYNFWNSTLRVLFPDKQFTNIKSAELAVNKLFDANQSVLVRFAPHPSYAGKTIGAIAKERNESEAVTLMNLIQIAAEYKQANPNAGGIEALAGKSMNDADVAEFIKWPYANICSDGAAGGHPRGYGAFTRVLGKFVREQQQLTLSKAIHKMTGLTAQQLGLQQRGKIAVGYFADLVLFDPTTVNDHATIENGKALSSGINSVWVNGKLVYQQQKATGVLSGTLIKRN